MTRIYSGLELIHYAFKDQIKSNSDLIALFVHWYLVKNGFECIIDGKVWFKFFELLKISCTLSRKCNILLEDRNFANRLEQRRSNLCDRLHI